MGLPAVQKTSREMRGFRRCCSVFGDEPKFAMGEYRGIVPAPKLGLTAAAGFFRGRRRFGIFCRRSHTRSVSSEIVTPSLASDCASSRMDAFARRSASSTSRYGSSSANRRERGRRPSATNRARVSGLPVEVPAAAWAVAVGSAGAAVSRICDRVGVAWSPSGGCPGTSGVKESCSPVDAGDGLGCMPVIYRSSAVGAKGACRSGSKPEGLDVGVLTYFFFWIWAMRSPQMTGSEFNFHLGQRINRFACRWSERLRLGFPKSVLAVKVILGSTFTALSSLSAHTVSQVIGHRKFSGGLRC